MTKFFCPKCKTEIKSENINSLYYTCDNCGFLDDSTFDMIMNDAVLIPRLEVSGESAPGVGDGSDPKKCMSLPRIRQLRASKTKRKEESEKP